MGAQRARHTAIVDAIPDIMCPSCGNKKEPAQDECAVCAALTSGRISRKYWEQLQGLRENDQNAIR